MSTGGGSGPTIPAVTAAAADRFGGQVGRRGRLDPAHLRRALRRGPHLRRGTGGLRHRAGRPGGHLGLQQRRVGGGRPRPARRRAPSSFPSTRGSRAARRPTSSPRSRARVLVTVTDFLGTDYVAMLRVHRRRASRPRDDHRGPRARAGRRRVVGRVRRPGHRRRPGRRRPAERRDWVRTIRPTSSSPRGRRDGPRVWS